MMVLWVNQAFAWKGIEIASKIQPQKEKEEE